MPAQKPHHQHGGRDMLASVPMDYRRGDQHGDQHGDQYLTRNVGESSGLI